MKAYYGDFLPGQTVRIGFNTTNASGVPTTLSSGAVTITKDGTDVSPGGGVTLTTDAGTVTGYHTVVIDTSADATTFSAGSEYRVRLSGSSNVGGTSAVGTILGSFSISNRHVDVQTVLGSTPISDASLISAFMANAVPTTGNVANSVADCLNAARADGFGKWVLTGTTLNLYAPDGSTIIKSFTLDQVPNPNSRS